MPDPKCWAELGQGDEGTRVEWEPGLHDSVETVQRLQSTLGQLVHDFATEPDLDAD